MIEILCFIMSLFSLYMCFIMKQIIDDSEREGNNFESGYIVFIYFLLSFIVFGISTYRIYYDSQFCYPYIRTL